MVSAVLAGTPVDTQMGVDLLQSWGAEAVVLGCTHFPYVKEALERRTSLPVLDPAERLAELVLGD